MCFFHDSWTSFGHLKKLVIYDNGAFIILPFMCMPCHDNVYISYLLNHKINFMLIDTNFMYNLLLKTGL
jgi:hypothetical protein